MVLLNVSVCLSTFALPPMVLIPSGCVTYKLRKKWIQWGPSVTALCGALFWAELSRQAPGGLLTSLDSFVELGVWPWCSHLQPRQALLPLRTHAFGVTGAMGESVTCRDRARLRTWQGCSSHSHSSWVSVRVLGYRSWCNSSFRVWPPTSNNPQSINCRATIYGKAPLFLSPDVPSKETLI